MSEALALADALDALAKALQALPETGAPAATVLDVELAQRWEALRAATVDFEARLKRWSQTLHETALEEQNLQADARTLSDAWSAAQAHLKKGGALAAPLKDVADKLGGERPDGQAELNAALKYALRSFPPQGGPALPPPPAPVEDTHAAAEILTLRGQVEELTAALAAAQEEATNAKAHLEVARRKAATPKPDAEAAALRAERDDLLAQLRQERAKPQTTVAPSEKSSKREEELEKELRRTKAKLAKLTAELGRK